MNNELLAMKRAIACIGGTVSQLCKECVDADYIRKNVDDSIKEMWFAKSEDSSRVSVDVDRLQTIRKIDITRPDGSQHTMYGQERIRDYLTGEEE